MTQNGICALHCVCLHVYMWACCISVCMCVYMCMLCVSVCVLVCVCVCVYMLRVYVYVLVCVYVCTRVYTCVCAEANILLFLLCCIALFQLRTQPLLVHHMKLKVPG